MGNLANNADLNDAKSAGVYFMSRTYSYSHSPLPSNTWGILEVLSHSDDSTKIRFQRIITASIIYFRTFDGTNWGSWYKLTGTAA